MDIVADTNIFLAVALDQPEKQWIIKQTKNAQIFSPEILPYEIGNALSAMLKRRQIEDKDAEILFNIINNIPVRLIPADISLSLKIAIKYNIYAYDAYFLFSAKARQCPLLTLDKKMQEVAENLNIKLLRESP